MQLCRVPVGCAPTLRLTRPYARSCSRATVTARCASGDAAAATEAPMAPPEIESNPEYVEVDTEFTLAKVSFGKIITPSGVILLLVGFATYFGLIPGQDISPLLLVYGFPATILGLALRYAQLEPAALKTSKKAYDLRATQMTDVQKQVREDCTRYRYGDEEHLEEALAKIFKIGRPGGLPRRRCPKLEGLRELVVDDAYTLVLEFTGTLSEEDWEQYRPKIQTFFGPGIICKITVGKKEADVYLISDKTGAGMTGKERPETFAPLQPGLQPRSAQEADSE